MTQLTTWRLCRLVRDWTGGRLVRQLVRFVRRRRQLATPRIDVWLALGWSMVIVTLVLCCDRPNMCGSVMTRTLSFGRLVITCV